MLNVVEPLDRFSERRIEASPMSAERVDRKVSRPQPMCDDLPLDGTSSGLVKARDRHDRADAERHGKDRRKRAADASRPVPCSELPHPMHDPLHRA